MKKGLMKIVALAAASVLAVTALAGCVTLEEKKENVAGTTEEKKENVVGTTEEKQELIMGTNAAFPPFEFTTSQGLVDEFDGIDVAIAKKIAENDGKTLKIEDMKFEGLIAAVSTGKVDMAVAGMTVTEERKQSVDFSDTYFVASQVMVVAADNKDITKAEDLKNNKTVGVVMGYTGDTIVTDNLKIDENKITRANRGLDIVQDVKNGKLDAVVIDSATGKALAEKNGLKVVEDAAAFETEEYAIAVKKGNKELLDRINSTLAEMKAKGEIDKLAVQYNQ